MNVERRGLVLAIVAVLSTGFFLVDLNAPRGAAVQVGYVAAVLVSLWSPRRQDTYLTAVAATVFTVLGLMLSPAGSPAWTGWFNYLLALVLLWLTTVLGLAARRTAQLAEANARLQEEVRERQRAEERVKEQAALLDQVPDAILVRDMEDRIRYWNSGAERLYGWSAAEALGQNANDLLFKDSRDELREAQRAVLANGDWAGEVRQATRDGREIMAEARWILVRDESGRPRAKLVINTDVTARKKLEGQLLRAQRLESIGTLAGGMAHDFNNLLTPILMAAKLLKRDRPEAERQNLLGTIQASAERGAEMVRQLLAFAGGYEGQPETVQPQAVIREVQAILNHTLPKSIRVEAAVPEDLWPIRADATQLGQVLMNLCVNARDAMPQGGTLAIAAGNVRLEPSQAAQHPDARTRPYVFVSIADTGEGIAPEVLDKIFDPFFTTKQPGQGTGLGLSTARGIVKAHGGFINVSSEAAKGSRFVVYLPALTEADAGTPRPEPSRPRAGQGELILVVDDEPFIRETTRTALESHGYRVLTAGDGGEALSVFEQHRPLVRAVLVDMMMPVLDGPATIEALRALDPHVRVVATSGLRGAARTAESGSVRESPFLQKPFSDEQVLEVLAKVLEHD